MKSWERITVVYEDNHLLVVIKPPNMPTQADRTGDADLHSTLKRYIAFQYNKLGAVYLGLVHRLDRPVGGLVVFAKTSKAAERLSAQVREKSLARTYLTIVRGNPRATDTLEDWLYKDHKNNMVHICAKTIRGAKAARLSYECLAQYGQLSLLSIHLETGRSHQIRVQLSHAGFPIWGDARYGKGSPGQQIALWGASLALFHPTRREIMSWTVFPPVETEPWSVFSGIYADWKVNIADENVLQVSSRTE